MAGAHHPRTRVGKSQGTPLQPRYGSAPAPPSSYLRFLFCVAGGYGHLHPLMPLAGALRQAGHEIAFAAGSTMACLDPEWQDYFQIAGWASSGLPQDAAVFSRKPRLFFVYSGRRSHDIPRTQDARQFLDAAREQHVRYVVVDRLGSLTLEYFGPIVSEHPDAFCLVQATQDGAAAILKMVPDAASLLQGPPHSAGSQLSLQTCATP